jgi:hypothetical protein
MDYVIRFLAGGIVVSMFAVLGDLLRPKRFAGLFCAALAAFGTDIWLTARYGAVPSLALGSMVWLSIAVSLFFLRHKFRRVTI